MVLEVIETESHFFSENIYLNRTERLRKVRTEDNTGVIRSQSSRSKKWIFLLDQGRDPFNQNFRKFRSKTQWIGSVQPEKFRKNGSTFWGGPLLPVGPVGILVEWIAPTKFSLEVQSVWYRCPPLPQTKRRNSLGLGSLLKKDVE